MRGARRGFPVRLAEVAVAALVVQLFAVFVLGDGGPGAALKRGLVVASYFGLLAVVLANLRLVAFRLVGLGLVLNLAAILANGGAMPVTEELILAAAPDHKVEELKPGALLPGSKDVLLERDEIRLWELSDRIVVDPPVLRAKVVSVGDLLVGVGLLCFPAEEALRMLCSGARRSRSRFRLGIGGEPKGNGTLG